MCGAGETHQRIAVGYANADRAWLLRQRAVVEAATISQSQALGIEAQARNQQCLRLHGAARSRHVVAVDVCGLQTSQKVRRYSRDRVLLSKLSSCSN